MPHPSPTIRAIFVGGPRDGELEIVAHDADEIRAPAPLPLVDALALDAGASVDTLAVVSYRRERLIDLDGSKVAIYVADGHRPDELTVYGLALARRDLRLRVEELEMALEVEHRARRRAEAHVSGLVRELESARQEAAVLAHRARSSGNG